MLRGWTVLLAFQLAGEFLTRLAGWPVPGPVVGMALLLVVLEVAPRRRRASGRSRPASSHLSLLFVPAGVGVMLHATRLGAEWRPILAALVVSTAAAIVVTGIVAERASRGGAGARGGTP